MTYTIKDIIFKKSFLDAIILKSDYLKIKELQKEMNLINSLSIEYLSYIEKNIFFYNLLTHINEQIWDTDNIINNITDINNEDYSKFTNIILELKLIQKRIQLYFSIFTNFFDGEYKIDNMKYCQINIKSKEDIYNKIPEINYIILNYDVIFFKATEDIIQILKQSFKNPNIIYDYTAINHILLSNKYIVNKDIDITFPDFLNKKYFYFVPIKYLNSGCLGDFLLALSVINENYLNTCRKGILFIYTHACHFNNGLENTYLDTFETISSQKYIHEYKIYTHNGWDIDLTHWRIIMNKCDSWYSNYSRIYGIEWGKNRWISNIKVDNSWNNKVIINTVSYRWGDFNYDILYQKYKDDLIFVANDENEYTFFKEKTSLQINFYQPSNFTDICIILNSCKLIVGGESMFAALAMAMQQNIIVILHNINGPNSKLDTVFNNIKYNI